MPSHDWTRVDAGLFHDFRLSWVVALAKALNAILPADHYALLEPPTDEAIPPEVPDSVFYARRADRIAVRNLGRELVAVLGIVSPGNKGSEVEFRVFIKTCVENLRRGVHLLVVDLLQPGPYDPHGLHNVVWNDFKHVETLSCPDRPPLVVAYDAAKNEAYVDDCLAVGDALPDMPLFLRAEHYVPVPLESTYQETWRAFPAALKGLLEGPASSP